MTTSEFDLAAGHRHFSAACFNGVWELIDKPDRSPDEDRTMVSMAHASLYHWQQRTDCTSRSLSIGYWQLSRVYALVDDAHHARLYGRLCLTYSEKEGPFYLGNAYEALARAALLSGDQEHGRQGLELARQQAAMITDAAERELLENDLKTLEDVVSAAIPNLTAHELEVLRQSVLKEIYDAFGDVSREGGVSWSESVVLDDYGDEEECAEARASDKEAHWSQLVDDPSWRCTLGTGGFSFLDPIGFRYYLAPVLVRYVRDEECEDCLLDSRLGEAPPELKSYRETQLSLLDARQRRCIARCLLFLARESAARSWDNGEHWLNVLDAGWWKDLDPGTSMSTNTGD